MNSLPVDSLAPLVPAEIQRLAARMAQDAFARVFRLSIAAAPAELDEAVGEIARRAGNWAQAGAADEARALRLALFISGLDQWGLAYVQAFDLAAIPGLTGLIGSLRTRLTPAEEARFEQQFAAIEAGEGQAIDFKLELRRHIHLALWAALIVEAEDDREGAERLQRALGSLLLALDARMPQMGWRLIADTLAHIQIRCLNTTLSEIGQQRTIELFSAVRAALPPERGDAIFDLANQAAANWRPQADASIQVH